MSYPTGGSSSPSGGCGRRIDASRKQGPHCGDYRPTAIPFAWSSRGTAESVVVKVFGCRPTKMTPRTPGPAYANLQRRKPREGIRQTVRRALSKMVSRVISIRSREFSKNLGFEYVYNFGVMARVLLTGESRFLSSCDFKELRVIKRARFTTLTLAASQHSFCSIARTEGLKKTSTRSN